MSSYIEDTTPLYISQDQYNNFITKINKNKTNTSWIYINQLSNYITRDYDFTKYRLYKTLDDTPKLYVLMNHKPANELPGGGESSTLVKCLTWAFGSYFPLDEGRCSLEDISFLNIGEPDENTINIVPNNSLEYISFIH
tara:strand:- start:11 stop:427 length:417 start_codon:yes stop_codon:yes gene_type:complete